LQVDDGNVVELDLDGKQEDDFPLRLLELPLHAREA
jgi:hypothetical protein